MRSFPRRVSRGRADADAARLKALVSAIHKRHWTPRHRWHWFCFAQTTRRATSQIRPGRVHLQRLQGDARRIKTDHLSAATGCRADIRRGHHIAFEVVRQCPGNCPLSNRRYRGCSLSSCRPRSTASVPSSISLASGSLPVICSTSRLSKR